MSLCMALTFSALCVIIPALLLWMWNGEDPN